MTLPALASLEALAARLAAPPASDEDLTRAQAALDDTSTLVRLEAGEDWINDEGELDGDVPDVIIMVTLQAARRAYLNPDGIRQESLGDHSVTYAGTGAVYLTAGERALIRKAVGLGGIGTITTTRGVLETTRDDGDLWPDEVTVAWPT